MVKERRKNIVIPVVLLLGIFIGGAIVLRTQGIGAQVLTEGKKVLFPIASEPDADPDGDGLKNWQEETYTTDPRNPDTDGDGYLDGEEVASGYNPAIPAPNDALPDTDINSPRPLPKNLTTQLAQILSQKIASGEIAPSQKDSLYDIASDPDVPYNQDLMDEALAQIGIRAREYFSPQIISDSDIKISGGNSSKMEHVTYITQLNTIFERHTNIIKELNMREIDVLQKTIQSNDINAITVYASEYGKSVDEIKNITAPRSIVEWHKQLISLVSVMAKIFDAVKNAKDDPIMAAAALESYIPTIEKLEVLSGQLHSFVPLQ